MCAFRSMRFVPDDSERTLARGASTGADAPIVDLEESVVPDRRSAGRAMVREDLAAATGAATNRDEAGERGFSARMARSLCLLAAHAARVQAIDMPSAPGPGSVPACDGCTGIRW